MIRVLICDDQEVVREGLQVILNSAPGLEVVGVAILRFQYRRQSER